MGTTPVLVKGPTQVNTTDAAVGAGGSDWQWDAQVAGLPDGGYMVVWTDESRAFNPDGTAVMGQRYDAQGERVGGEIYFNFFGRIGDLSSPAIAVFADGGIAVAYRGGGRINVEGDLTAFATDAGVVRTDPALAILSNDNWVMAYTWGSGADTDIVARIRPRDGFGAGEFAIHDQADNSGNVELATLSNGNFVAVFEDEFEGNAADTDIRFRIFTANGTPVHPATGSIGETVLGAFSTGAETDPDVAALTGGGFVVVCADASSTARDIRATVFTNAGGRPLRHSGQCHPGGDPERGRCGCAGRRRLPRHLE